MMCVFTAKLFFFQWTDGNVANTFREFSSTDTADRKWVVFDGPIDTLWIESMNTVLDDNKKLCLMSGEIIQMSPPMSLIFETQDLSQASVSALSVCHFFLRLIHFGIDVILSSTFKNTVSLERQCCLAHSYKAYVTCLKTQFLKEACCRFSVVLKNADLIFFKSKLWCALQKGFLRKINLWKFSHAATSTVERCFSFDYINISFFQPATVSRCGMIYLEPLSLGWKPMFDSWLETLPPVLSEDNAKLIEALFETFVPPCVRFVHKTCKEVSQSKGL